MSFFHSEKSSGQDPGRVSKAIQRKLYQQPSIMVRQARSTLAQFLIPKNVDIYP